MHNSIINKRTRGYKVSKPTQDTVNNFRKEFAELLEKYNAHVVWTCGSCSDTHGIYDEKMLVDIGGRDVLTVDGACIGASDVKNCLTDSF